MKMYQYFLLALVLGGSAIALAPLAKVVHEQGATSKACKLPDPPLASMPEPLASINSRPCYCCIFCQYPQIGCCQMCCPN